MFLLGWIFFGWWESHEWFWPIKSFSKLKTSFCKYWTSIKIKICMACLYKDYEVKWRWNRRNGCFYWRFYLVTKWNLLFSERNEPFLGEEIFPGHNMNKFLVVEGESPSSCLVWITQISETYFQCVFKTPLP